MNGVHIKSIKLAIERLTSAEIEVLQKIANENRPEDRKEYLDIRETLEALNSEVRQRQSWILKLLHRLKPTQ